jgi:RNA polymerase sigma factor (sigma-70 family)
VVNPAEDAGIDRDEVEILESELMIARQGASSASRSARGLVPLNDLVGEAFLWMVGHYDKVAQWRQEGRHGQNKLRMACRMACLSVVAEERRKRSGLQRGDSFFYTQAIVRELLPAIFDRDEWTAGPAYDTEVRGPSRPSEGNTRLAMIIDVRVAFDSLPEQDQNMLMWLYRDNGLTFEQLGEMMEVHERTARRREERAIERMVERLGGENPWRR